jgi:hypothetical protein
MVKIPLKQLKQSGAFNGDLIRYNDGYSTWESSTESLPTILDKNLTSVPTIGNGAVTNIAISATPAGTQYVGVSINGMSYIVGDGSKLFDCYFSNDVGVTARSFANIVIGDELYWNGIIAGFNLDIIDRIDLYYNM